ncbi:MAG: hypothetical protein RI885_1105 [Actinomycetota bacterium]|jgi:hypothetical protein
MTFTPAARLVVAGLALLAVGAAGLAVTARQFLSAPYPLDSNSGRAVFLVDDTLVSYEMFSPGGWPLVIGAGSVLVVSGLLAAAVLWRGRPSPTPGPGTG